MRKSSARLSWTPVSSPYWKSCEACGREPASSAAQEKGGRSLLCSGCLVRRDNSEKSPYLAEIDIWLRPVDDFEVLAEKARPDGYLALVYLDVDSLGKHFDKLEPFTVENYRQASQGVKKAVEGAVFKSCQRICGPLTKETTAPFEILLIGGDDALVLLQPQHVYRFLRWFRKTFQSLAPTFDGPLTFSAAVVFAHHHLPISQFVHHAKQLLRSAKRDGGGRTDYMVITESITAGVNARDSKRTMRPYPVKDFLWLWRTIAHWKTLGFPTGRAHQLYRAAYEEEQQGLFDYLYLLSRLKTKHRVLALRMFRNGFWETTPKRATRAADIGELWDFVEEA